MWSDGAAALHRDVGLEDEQVAGKFPGLLEDYVEAWLRHNLCAEDSDPTWWPDVKDVRVRMFPSMGRQLSVHTDSAGC